jgi:6-phosphogluconolactonase (cycloisomerase 2 family)
MPVAPLTGMAAFSHTGSVFYAVNDTATGGALYEYQVSAGGDLTPLPSVSVPLPPAVFPSVIADLVLTRSDRYLYATYGNAIYQFSCGNDGAVSARVPASVATGGSGSYTARLDRSDKFLYVANSLSDSVSGFAVQDDGTLQPLNPLTVPVKHPVGLAIAALGGTPEPPTNVAVH